MLGVCKGVCTSSESYFYFFFLPSSFLSLLLYSEKKNTPPFPLLAPQVKSPRVFFSPLFPSKKKVGGNQTGRRREVDGLSLQQSSRLSIVVRASVGRRIVAESNVCVASPLCQSLPPTFNWDLVFYFYPLVGSWNSIFC